MKIITTILLALAICSCGARKVDKTTTEENSVVSKMETTASDDKNYITNYYNLDAIISVGYRVNSTKATQFRIWATQTGCLWCATDRVRATNLCSQRIRRVC